MQLNPLTKSCILLCFLWYAEAQAQVNASFTYTEGCNGTVTFTATQQTDTFYQWSFGDGTYANGISTVHQYAQGAYYVSLFAAGPAGYDSSSQQIYVGPYIQQQITGPTDICAGSTAGFSLTNASGNFQYNWLTSAGTIIGNSHNDSVNILYTDTGASVLSVLISNGAGCDSILQQTVHVHLVPHLILLPGQGNDTNQLQLTICQNKPVWYYVLTQVPGNITWNNTGAFPLSAEGVDSILYLYPNAGTFSMQVLETTPWGCNDSVSELLTVSPSPVVTVSGTNACLGSDNYFTATSTPPGQALSYQWLFDDGGHATGNPVSHTFPNAGTHSAIITATNANGCSDTASTHVQVDVTPGPVITCVGPVCAAAQEVYTTPPVNGATYNWNVTGGSISSGGGTSDNTVGVQWGNGPLGTLQLYLTGGGVYCQTPTVEQVPIIGSGITIQGPASPCLYNTVTYSTQLIPGGVYNWTLSSGSIQSGQGTNQIQAYFWVSSSTTVSVAISHEILSCTDNPSLTITPESPFSIYAATGACAGVLTAFTTYQTGNFNWTVQGGTIISGNGTGSITVLWANAGTYTVTASIPTGFCNTVAQTTVAVVKPVKETVQGAAQACVNSTQTYFISPNESSYSWTANSGGTIVGNATSNSVQITWNTAGNDTATVIYSNNNGCPDTAYYYVTAVSDSVQGITGDTVACFGTTENFTYTGGAGIPYVWQANGGVITAGQNTSNVSVMWIAEQTGLIRLSNAVCNTFEQKNMVIRPIPAVNILTQNLNCTGSSASLVVAQDYPVYNWSNGPTAQSITITTPGAYNVTVSDAFGCTGSATENANPIPSLGFTSLNIIPTYPGGGPVPYVQLNAEASPTPTNYAWSTANNSYSYEDADAPGVYSVTVTNQYDCTASASATVTLVQITGNCTGCTTMTVLPCNIPPPIYNTNSPVCNPVQFTPTMTASDYFWDFGDNVYSYQSNPSHRFIVPGAQNVTLYYSNDGVTWYECSQSFTITSIMNVSFAYSGGCKGAVTLTNTATSVLPITSATWRLGDGNTSTTSPVLSYQYPNNASTYLVSLILTDALCTDSIQQPVNVDELKAGFAWSGVCVDNPALFNDATIHSAIISSYSWYFDNGGGTADYYDPLTYYTAPGNYNDTLIVKDANGCLDTSVQIVPVNQFTPPAISASGPLTFCQGSSVTLSLPAGNSYYWSSADTSPAVTVTQSGNYFAWAQNAATGCSGFTDTVSVIEHIPPAAFISNPGMQTQFCEGAYIYLYGLPNEATSYQWYLNNAALTTNQNNYIYYAQPIQSGGYQLVITDAFGCHDTSAVLSIVINPSPAQPAITQSPNGLVCPGQSVTLSITGPDFYQWSTGATGSSTTVQQSGGYEVFATNSFGCSSNNFAYVNYSAAPDFSLFPVGCYQICPNNNITVSGPAGMSSYLWSDGETTQNITLVTSGTYTLTATAPGGCSAQSDSFTVDVFSAANIPLGNDTNICAGQTVVLDAGAYPQITWQDNSTNQFYTVTDSGMYSVTVTTSQGCTASDSILVSVHSPSVDLGNDTTICGSNPLVLSVGGNFATVIWQDNSTGNTYTVTQSGLYYVKVTDTWGCKASDSITVTVASFNTVNLGDDTTICKGDSLVLSAAGNFSSISWQDGSQGPAYVVTASGLYYVSVTEGSCSASDSITVKVDTVSVFLGDDTTICANVTLLLSVAGNYNGITWQDGSTGNTYQVTQSGLYSVSVTDAALCSASDSITVSNYPALQTGQIPAQNLCDSTCTLSVTGTYSVYLWSTGSTSPTITVSDSGIYYVTVSDSNGCTGTDTAQVNPCQQPFKPDRYYIPNVFSPNGDGKNDEFGVYVNTGAQPATFFDMKIYDRWGEKLFDAQSESATWDGTYKGKRVDPGVLVYVIKYVTSQENATVQGTLTLLR